jgi:hypothetical protein
MTARALVTDDGIGVLVVSGRVVLPEVCLLADGLGLRVAATAGALPANRVG